jgi:DedD protein
LAAAISYTRAAEEGRLLQQMMDRALQERIVGAVVLVIFAILIVPIFLDGPSDESEIISESVTLPGQNNQERKQQTIVLERDRTEPVPSAPAATTTAENTPQVAEQKPAQVVEEKPQAKPQPQEAAESTVEAEPATKEPATESSTGMWAVQLGSFSSQENAERLAADLRGQGYAAFLSQLQTDSGSLHRVRIGPQKDRDSAKAVAEQLSTGGHEGQVVPHP